VFQGVTMASQSRAHGLSLPLFALMQRSEGENAGDASLRVRSGVQALKLEGDIDVVIVISQGAAQVGMEPRSDFGAQILREVMARAEFVPCPEGTCEYDEHGACKWCGSIPRQ
jgi:hypothetical protein